MSADSHDWHWLTNETSWVYVQLNVWYSYLKLMKFDIVFSFSLNVVFVFVEANGKTILVDS